MTCEHWSAPGARFCVQCGAPLVTLSHGEVLDHVAKVIETAKQFVVNRQLCPYCMNPVTEKHTMLDVGGVLVIQCPYFPLDATPVVLTSGWRPPE